MSGILDNKSRVIDAILTTEGRRQMADGNFVVKFVTFSDSSVFYQKDDSGHEDPTNKIYLECFNLPQDQIIFESDDSGNIVPFKSIDTFGLSSAESTTSGSLSWTIFRDGQLRQYDKTYGKNYQITGSATSTKITDTNFASQIEGILTASFDNFRKLKIIGSKDEVFEDNEFALSSNEITFEIVPDEMSLQMQNASMLDDVDALFNDEKLRNVDNFMYLPPIKKTSGALVDKKNIKELETSGRFLGDYRPWGPIDKLTYEDISAELSKYESSAKTIYFDPTSRDNNLVAQMFEIAPDKVSKLDVIDYGKVNNNSSNPFADTHHIFFIGKALEDSTGATNFIHLFTLVFETNEENSANRAY